MNTQKLIRDVLINNCPACEGDNCHTHLDNDNDEGLEMVCEDCNYTWRKDFDLE